MKEPWACRVEEEPFGGFVRAFEIAAQLARTLSANRQVGVGAYITFNSKIFTFFMFYFSFSFDCESKNSDWFSRERK